jgi:hypothetical protein
MAPACSYGPHPKDGQQQCFLPDRSCPDGYVCKADTRCWSIGHSPGGTPGVGGAVVGSGGTIGNGGIIGTGGADIGGAMGTGGRLGSGGQVGTGGGAAGILGTGGVIPTGGIAGTGGATSCAPTRASGSFPVIDTVSDGDGSIPQQDGRSGGWYSFNDGIGTQTPMPPAITAKPGWICSAGSGFASWGAAIGVSLNADATKSCTYDASVYKGVTFAVQGSVTGGKLRFNLQTADITASTGGGTCVSSGTGNGCDDYYGAEVLGNSFQGAASVSCASNTASWICSSASATSTSNLVTIPFANTSQEGWGKSFPALNLSQLLQLQWEIKDYYQSLNYGPIAFNLCVGNVSFY